jgi:hypothetical protein
MAAYFVVELEITNPAAMEPTGRRMAPQSSNMGAASWPGPARRN